MSAPALKLLEIGETQPIRSDYPEKIRGVEQLLRAYVTDLFIPETGDRPRVDAFGLLYAVLREIYCLPQRAVRRGQIHVEIGEGFGLVGHRDGHRCWVTIGFGAKFGTRELTIAEYLWALTTIVADLSASIRKAGIDVDNLMQRFPPDLECDRRLPPDIEKFLASLPRA